MNSFYCRCRDYPNMKKNTIKLVRRCLEPYLSCSSTRVIPTKAGQVAVLQRTPPCARSLFDALARIGDSDVRKGCAAIIAAGCHLNTPRSIEAALAGMFSGQGGLIAPLEAALLIRACRLQLAESSRALD